MVERGYYGENAEVVLVQKVECGIDVVASPVVMRIKGCDSL